MIDFVVVCQLLIEIFEHVFIIKIHEMASGHFLLTKALIEKMFRSWPHPDYIFKETGE